MRRASVRVSRRDILRATVASAGSTVLAIPMVACSGAPASTGATALVSTPVSTNATTAPAMGMGAAMGTATAPAAAAATGPVTISGTATIVPTGVSAAQASPAMAASAAAPVSATIAPVSGQVTLYASVPQDTLDAMIRAFTAQNPMAKVNLFRNGTGPVVAKVAAEQKAGKVQADLVWLAEPTAIQDWSRGGLLAAWTPTDAAAVPDVYKGPDFWGTRIINVALGYHKGASSPRPADWMDLTNPAYKGKVGIPNPNYAGSTLGALGYFAQTPQYGFAFYQALAKNGAVQLQGNQEVADGIAQGRFDTGFLLDYMALPMIAKGSPIELIWPTSGAIAVPSPIAVTKDASNVPAARQFVNFVLSTEGQTLLAAQSFQPIRTDIPYTGKPADVKTVQPDWPALLKNQQDLLDKYGAIVPG